MQTASSGFRFGLGFGCALIAIPVVLFGLCCGGFAMLVGLVSSEAGSVQEKARSIQTRPATIEPATRPAKANVAELCLDDLKIGQIGPIQIQSGNKDHPVVTVVGVISADEFLAVWGGKIYLIRGLSTLGIVDGHKLQLSGIFAVSSTKLSSGRTVFVLTFVCH